MVNAEYKLTQSLIDKIPRSSARSAGHRAHAQSADRSAFLKFLLVLMFVD